MAAQGRVNYVWVDVACINQGRDSPEDIAEGADQVGKQMIIFSQASNAFVWLCGTSSIEIKETLAAGFEAQFQLEDELSLFKEVNQPHSFTVKNESEFDKEISEVMSSLPIRNFSKDKEKVILGFLDSLEAALDRLTSDRWFSSLWTLQESVLRRYAILLAQEGTHVVAAGTEKTPVTLAMVANSYRNLIMDLDRYLLWIRSPNIVEKMVYLRSRTRRTILAFMVCNNPNVPYCLARYRECKEEEDWLYGVMQVYGFQLGKTVQRHLSFDLNDLNAQFAKTLNEWNPVVGQMVVHTDVPERGTSWKITPGCDVPEDLGVYDPFPAFEPSAPEIAAEALVHGDASSSFPAVNIYYDNQEQAYVIDSISPRFGLAFEILPERDCEIRIRVNRNQTSNIRGYGWLLSKMEDTLLQGLGRLYFDATDSPWINLADRTANADTAGFQSVCRDEKYMRQSLVEQFNMLGALMSKTKSDVYLVYLGRVRRGTSLGNWPAYLGLVAFGARDSGTWKRLGICTWEKPCIIWPRWQNITTVLL